MTNLNYNEFKEMVFEEFKNYLPQKCQNMQLKISKITKVNVVYDGMTLVDENSDEEGRKVSPTIYINDMYDAYQLSGSGTTDEVIKRFADMMSRAMEESNVVIKKLENNFNENIIMMLINTKQNEELLKEIPHREFLDLSVTYRLASFEEGEIQSAIINNSLAAQKGLSEEQLFALAYENECRLLPPIVTPLDDIIRRMMLEDGTPEFIVDIMMEKLPDNPMTVLSNKEGYYGAVAMLYDDVLENLAQRTDSDLYILPSSIHECIAIPVSLGELESLEEMVHEVNFCEVAASERLSNEVYRYSRATGKVTIVSDVANKRLV